MKLESFYSLSRILGIFVLYSITGCGGPQIVQLVAPTRPYDDQLNCEYLMAERAVNDEKIKDILSEKQEHENHNLALALAGGVGGLGLMDLTDSERREIQAYKTRNNNLERLMKTKCHDASAN